MNDVNTLAALLRENAERFPELTAITYQDRRYTFAEHYQRALRLADALRSLGCRAGDRVAVLARNCVEYLELYSACELAGYITVPVNFRLSATEALFVCNNTGAGYCFYTAEYEKHVYELRKSTISIARFIEIGGSAREYEQFLENASESTPLQEPLAGDPACIIHTSGTTGQPKGAVLSQGALLGIARNISSDAKLSRADYGLVMQPLFHVGAKFLQLAHHCQAAAIRIEHAFDPALAWQILGEEPITTLQLVPTMLDMLLAQSESVGYPDTHLTTIFYSTAPIRESLLRKGLAVFGQVFLQQYGSTEGGQITSLPRHLHINDGSEKEQQWLLSAGKANPGVEIKIVDHEGKEMPAGEAGEIIVRHDNLMLGYWNDEAATANTIINGYLYMGDIGYLDDDGFLYIVDRKKDMIISGGENIYPREVEVALLLHPAVAEVAVIGIPDERWGEAVHGVVVCHPDKQVSPAELIAHSRKHIASYKKPKSVDFVSSLPRIATGKVDKVSLRKPYWQQQPRKV